MPCFTVTLTSPVAADCADIAKALAGIAADLTCLESTPFRTAIDAGRTFPGLQITGAMADDPNARWLLRLPASAN